MKEGIAQFSSKDTSFKESEEPIREFPTLTICFKHEGREDKKYFFAMYLCYLGDVLAMPWRCLENVSILFCHESSLIVGSQSYTYGIHFNISYNGLKVPYDSYEESNEYTSQDIEYEYFEEEKSALKIDYHKIYSYLSGTSCYKLKQMNLKEEVGLGSHDHMALKIDFDESLEVNELPNVELYLTSEGNSHGVIFNEWMDGDDLKFVFHKVCELHMFSSDGLNTILLNMERTQICSSIGDRTQTPYFWLRKNEL